MCISDMKYNPFYTILIGLEDAGYTIETQAFFDTLKIQPKNNLSEIQERAKSKEINLRYFSDGCVSTILFLWPVQKNRSM